MNLLTRLFWHRQFHQRNKPDRSKRVPTALDFYERVNFRWFLFFSVLSFSSLLRFRETRIPVDSAFHFYTLFSPSPFFSPFLNPSFFQENDILKCHPHPLVSRIRVRNLISSRPLKNTAIRANCITTA